VNIGGNKLISKTPMTYLLFDRATTKEELAQELGVWVSALYDLQNFFYIYLDDFANRYPSRSTLDDYQEWLFRRFTVDAYLLRGRNEKKRRINRVKIKQELAQNPNKYSFQAFKQNRIKGATNPNETTRIIRFNFIKRQRIR
jgi:hypothetical protein